MMADVHSRNVSLEYHLQPVFNKCFQAIIYFYSRIVLSKINVEALTEFRKLEKNIKNVTKVKADIRFLSG